MEVALVNVSHRPADARRNFSRVLDHPGVDLTVYDARGLAFPDPDAIDCAVITGSIDSVTDDRPYVHELLEWIKTVDVPLLGVCFGHQAIAVAHGGRVTAMERDDRELGYHVVTHDGDPLFDGIPTTFLVYASHGDYVVDPPADADVIAWNDRGVQGLRLGEAVSIQFHPEVDRTFGRVLTRDVDVPDRVRSAALESLTDDNERSARIALAVFDNFLEAVAAANGS